MTALNSGRWYIQQQTDLPERAPPGGVGQTNPFALLKSGSIKTKESRIELNDVGRRIGNFSEIGIHRFGDINTFRAGAKSSLTAADICCVVIRIAAENGSGINFRGENRDSKKARNDARKPNSGQPPLTNKIFHNNVLYTLERKIRNY